MTSVHEYLTSLPDELSRSFEVDLTAYVSKNASDALEAELTALLTSSDAAYPAFYALSILHRQRKDYLKLEKLFSEHPVFKRYNSYNHIWILCQIDGDFLYEYRTMLELAYNDASRVPDNAGYVHLFADVFVSICEKCEPRERPILISRWQKHAIDAVNTAIELDPGYAKYYCTKGRILALSNSYPEALSLIAHAMALESSSRSDYALRLLGYRFYEMKVMMEKQRYELTRLLTHQQENRHDRFTGNEVPRPAVYDGDDTFAFVSYSHDDKASVYPLISQLSDMGCRIWYDSGIKAGADYADVLADKIDTCSEMLLFVTHASIDSGRVRDEITLAKNFDKRILCIFLEDVMLRGGMSLQLERYHHIYRSACMDSREFLDMLYKEMDSK